MLKFYINRLKQRHAEDKIRFFTNTAHDLRTSITLINAPIQELNKEKELYRFKIFGDGADEAGFIIKAVILKR